MASVSTGVLTEARLALLEDLFETSSGSFQLLGDLLAGRSVELCPPDEVGACEASAWWVGMPVVHAPGVSLIEVRALSLFRCPPSCPGGGREPVS